MEIPNHIRRNWQIYVIGGLVLAVILIELTIKKAPPAFKQNDQVNYQAPSNSPSQQKEWYEGGTLHRAKISDWKRASHQNKLATCADFISGTTKGITLEEVRIRATALQSCIEESTRGIDNVDNNDVAEVAAMCQILLKDD